MLRLQPPARGAWRLYQILDLQTLPPDGSGKSREIELSASLATVDADTAVRFFIRAFAVTEAPDEMDASWLDRRDEAIAPVTRGASCSSLACAPPTRARGNRRCTSMTCA